MATVHKQWSRLHSVSDKSAVAAPVERKYAIRYHAFTTHRWFAVQKERRKHAGHDLEQTFFPGSL
jgi:hypothetical protein